MGIDEKKKKGVHPAAAALTGLAIGVAAGVAATTLSDKDKRDKLKKQAKDTYDSATGEVDKAVKSQGKKIKDALSDAFKQGETAASQAKKSAQEVIDHANEKVDELEAEVVEEKEAKK